MAFGTKLGLKPLAPKKAFHMFTPSKRIADANRMKKGMSMGKMNKGLAPVNIKF